MSKRDEFDSVQLLMREINQIPLLTSEEYDDLLARIGHGDLEARDKFLRANLRLVIANVKQYNGKGGSLKFLDLFQEGCMGMMRALDLFDPSLGYRFSTYATPWIKQSISRAIANKGRTVRIPVHMISTMSAIQRADYDLTQLYGYATDREIAEYLGIEEELVRKMKKYANDASSLDTTIGDDEDTTVGDLIEDKNSIDAQEVSENNALHDALMNMLNTLDDREAKVISMRFGLEDGHPRTLEEVGANFGVTRERIRQIEAKALRKLRHPMRSRQLRAYLED